MHATNSPIYQVQQIREFERLARERFGINNDLMMQRAGKASYDFLIRRWPQAQHIAIFCGGGNNGGDGYVLARLLHERGLKPVIWQVVEQVNPLPHLQKVVAACREAKIAIQSFHATADLHQPDLIVDAICGIGANTVMRPDVVAAIDIIQQAQAPIFALDTPTGIDADTGRVLGVAVRATATLTYIGLKPGLLTGSGIAYTGELALNELQFPTELLLSAHPVAERTYLGVYQHYLKPRPRDWHKGLSGRVLVIGGELGYAGAPRMAAEAALRVGAGLVTVATRLENALEMTTACPELMCRGVLGADDLLPLLEKTDVVVLGPGMGQSEWSKELWGAVMAAKLPLVIDADGLNLLAQYPAHHEHWILTPHPGEAARLLGKSVWEVQDDRLSAVQEINKQYGGITVLKGAGTLVQVPNTTPVLCDKGNPGMATAGMGDVLSGVIAGLLAQGIPSGEAAKAGVCMHAMAGDLAAKDGERGMIATDLMPYLRRLANYSN